MGNGSVSSGGNDDGRVTMKWVAGALATIVFTGGVGWLNYVSGQVDELRTQSREESRDNAAVRERLKAVETKLETVDATTKETAGDVRSIRQSVEELRATSGSPSLSRPR